MTFTTKLKRLLFSFCALPLLPLLGSCIMLPVGPVGGIVFTSTKFAGEVNPANDVEAVKSATGCQQNILFLVTWGDAGAGDIAYENGIKRIATIDHSTKNFIYIYREYCTIVTGE